MLLLAIWQLPKLALDSNILALFPDADSRTAEARVEQTLSKRFERSVVLLLGADDDAQARQLLPVVMDSLQQCSCFELTQTDLSGAALETLYRGHTSALLTPQWQEKLATLTPEQLLDQAQRRLLTRPGGMSAASLIHDPLGTLADFNRATKPATNIRIDASSNPYVVINERRFYVVPLTLSGSPFNVALQNQAHDALQRAEGIWRDLSGAKVLKTGALFYTLAGTEQAQQEMSTVGLGSLLGIIVLLLLVFRSPALLLLAFVPLAAGVLAGLATSSLMFGAVHVVALVFGAALVGVAIDYGLHYFSARMALGPQWLAGDGTRHLLPPLALGLATSVVGYLSFIAAGFPGFTQIAVLSSTGLITALATVLLLYPRLLAKAPKRSVPVYLQRLVMAAGRSHERLLRPVARPVWLFLILLILTVLLTFAPSSDSIRQMQQPSPTLVEMEAQVRNSLGAGASLQYVLVQAPSDAVLLQRIEQAAERLHSLQATSALAGFDALTRVLPSPMQQQANRASWQAAVVDAGVLKQLAERLQLTAAAYQKMLKATGNPVAVSLPELQSTLTERPDLPLYLADNDGHYSAISLTAPLNLEAITQALIGLEGVSLVDPVARTDQLLKHYRRSAAGLLLFAYAFIALFLTRRYGGLGALMVVLPPALASVFALTLISVLGQALNVFHMMALLLVLGIGIDYTLFLREARTEQLGTRLAIGLSTLTTVLSFGLLALSATAAIHSFGLTVLVGIILAYFLAPLAVLAKATKIT